MLERFADVWSVSAYDQSVLNRWDLFIVWEWVGPCGQDEVKRENRSYDMKYWEKELIITLNNRSVNFEYIFRQT